MRRTLLHSSCALVVASIFAFGCSSSSSSLQSNAQATRALLPRDAGAPKALTISAPDRSPADDLRVMTFNLRVRVILDGPNYWDFRKDLVVRTIREFDPDVLGTQEGLADMERYLQSRLPDYGFVGVGRDDGKRGGEMCGVFYKTSKFIKLDEG